MTALVRCKGCGKIIPLSADDAGQWVVCSACGESFKPPPIEQWGLSEHWEDRLDPNANEYLAHARDTSPIPAAAPSLDALPAEFAPLPNALPAPAPLPPPHEPSRHNWLVVGVAAVVVFAIGLMVMGIVAVMRDARSDRDRGPVARVQEPRPQAPPAQPPAEQVRPQSPSTIPSTQALASAVNRIIDRTSDIVERTRRQSDSADAAEGLGPVIAHAPRPPAQKVPLRQTAVTDEQIGQAIQRGVDFLLTQFQHDRLRAARNAEENYYTGLNALSVYALLQAAHAIDDERLSHRGRTMKALLDELKRMPMKGAHTTYARSIRANTLALLNRPEDRPTLRDDVMWLLKNHTNGAYTYDEPPQGTFNIFDNSNAQYGLLGVWAGAEAGLEVPNAYWNAVRKHWTNTQYESGEWGYNMAGRSGGGLSMTAAGLASLFVTHDQLEAPQFGSEVGRDPFSKPLARGLAWMETDDNCLKIGDVWRGYILYGIERVGLASGFKYFGKHDWYRVLAARVLELQRQDGSWGSAGNARTIEQLRAEQPPVVGNDEIAETAFSLLFLARGRHPVLMNKLRFAGDWANRPRDVANLARFASAEMERPLNWQVVPFDREWTDWMDSPILYIASHLPPNLAENDLLKIRRFIDAGGLLFTHADGGSPQFNDFITDLAAKLFPGSAFQDLPPDHELYTLNYRIDPTPELKFIGNGARIFMLHSPADISQHWQLRADRTKRNLFQFGTNLFLYAAGKRDLRNRLASTHLPEPQWEAPYTTRLARVMYTGAWDPEPAAFERFARHFKYETGYELRVTAVGTEELRVQTYPVAHLTGTAAISLSESQVSQLRRYVQDGGVLLIDACGGSPDFTASALDLLAQAFPSKSLSAMPTDHPLLAGAADGMHPLPRPELRTYTEQKIGRAAARLETLSPGRGRVIFSNLDLTSGLLGTNTWGILGYQPDYAQTLLKNLILWTLDGAKSEPQKASAAADAR